MPAMRNKVLRSLRLGTGAVLARAALGILAGATMMAAACRDAGAQQVFIQGTSAGIVVVDTPGKAYPDSADAIIRATGSGAIYSGENISGSTVAGVNSFVGARADNGGQINFTGTATFTVQGMNAGAAGFIVVNPSSRITGETVSLATELGSAVNVQGGSVQIFNGLTVVTNRSQQDLVPLLTALPQYPNLAGIDPLDLDHSTDPLNLAAFAIASPAQGISLSAGTSLAVSGPTSITAGGIGLNVTGGTAILNGPTVINAGPGGTANTWMHGVRVGSGGRVEMNGSLQMTVDSVAGSGFRVEGATSTVILNADGGTIGITLLNPQNTNINNVNEASALYASAGTIQATGNLQLEANQGRGYGLWTNGAGATILVTGDTAIATHGREGFGIRLDTGLIDLDGNLTIVTGINPSSPDALDGAAAAGLRATTGELNVSGTTSVTTVGGIVPVGSSPFSQTRESAYGLWNTSFSRLQGDGANMTFSGPVTIDTAGAAAHGVYNDTVSGTITFGGPVDIATSGGMGSVTWHRTFGGTFPAIRNETVGAWGVNNVVSGTTTFQGPLTVTTTGEGSGGVRVTGGTVNIQSGVDVTTAGTNAFGLLATSATAGATTFNGTMNVAGLADISTGGAGAHAIFADQGGSILFTGGAMLRVADPAAKGILASGNSSIVGSGVFDIDADLQSQGNALLDLRMDPCRYSLGRRSAVTLRPSISPWSAACGT